MKNKLQILTEGQEGYGVLIEGDAGYTTNNWSNALLKETTLVDDGIKRIYIDCILQKADTLNRNGRIYPKNVLIREDQKYQSLIQSNNAFGECVDGLTEIFTTNGWKFIKDIS